MALSMIACLGRHTITGLLCTQGNQFADWTASYRLFSHSRFDQDRLFAALRAQVLDLLPDGRPLVVALDDTIVRKTSKKTPGVSYRRDPLGPRFQVNLVLAQRFLQMSAVVPAGAATRAIPIDLQHAPTPKKPGKNATPQDLQTFKQLQRRTNISKLAAQRISTLRQGVDRSDEPSRRIHFIADGRYTNKTIMRTLPERTTFTGRIRADAKLFFPPQDSDIAATGRKRRYGRQAPRPEQLRTDETVPYEEIKVISSGDTRRMRIKTIAPVLWKTAGYTVPLRLIVIAPTAYRLRKGSKLLYRQPAHLITTDLHTPPHQLVQQYVWRWDIEVNFRDEKQMLGVGEAQVRNQASVQNAPALAVAAYACLLLSAIRAYGANGRPEILPPPKWMEKRKKPRATTADIRQAFRHALWSRGITSFADFTDALPHDTKSAKHPVQLLSAACYAS